jgi:hypothetical protein
MKHDHEHDGAGRQAVARLPRNAALKSHRLERDVFATSRLIEFCSLKELTAQTGHPAEQATRRICATRRPCKVGRTRSGIGSDNVSSRTHKNAGDAPTAPFNSAAYPNGDRWADILEDPKGAHNLITHYSERQRGLKWTPSVGPPEPVC